jgi:N-acetylglucosamine-6-phosphate deacetylase
MCLCAGRIAQVHPIVDVSEAGHAGTTGCSDYGTLGAGAERSVAEAPDRRVVDPAAGGHPLAAGDDRRRAVAPVAARLDATGLLVAPGFVDLQCNGAAGLDVTAAPERMWDVAAALPRWGVAAWLPTVITAPAAIRARALAALRSGPPDDGVPRATVLGLHFEGPFLAPKRLGAHDPRHLAAPSVAAVEAEGWSRAAGVAMVTLAPERPGALAVVRRLVDAGVVVAAGHSSATADEARAALDAGVTHVTHLFNAMAPLHHREPGLAGVALTDQRARVGLIADGLHVDPAVVAVAARALGDRLTLVTDAVAALGAPPGPVRLGDVDATVSAGDGGVRLADGTLAGSTLALDRAVRNLVSFAGVPLSDAVRAATATPAAALGLADRGVVAPGAVGDLVLLTPSGELVATVVAGRVAYDRRAVTS